MDDCEIAVVGAGAAGLSLAHRLCAPEPGWGPVPAVTLIDAPPGPARPPERTWCYWEKPGGEFDDALSAEWETLRVCAPDGTRVSGSPAPLRYKMLRSSSFEALVGARIDAEPRLRRVEAHVEEVRDTGAGAEIRGTAADGRPVS
ncbi:lycopene cyclase family protein, partial [Streptomyces flavofungini]|uniref:lycopene cyclase family protein n=1 Tax=Streptomyces flavofungini TaxID=68200 RepID=UPI0034DE07F3